MKQELILRVSGDRGLLITVLGDARRTTELTPDQARGLSRGLIEAANLAAAEAIGPVQGNA